MTRGFCARAGAISSFIGENRSWQWWKCRSLILFFLLYLQSVYRVDGGGLSVHQQGGVRRVVL